MRILHICSSFSEGGQSRVILSLGRHQLRRHEVGVLATSFPGHHWPEARKLFSTCLLVSRRNKLARYLSALRCLNSFRPDVVHIHQEPYGPLLARLAGARAIVESVHSLLAWKTSGHRLLRILRPFLVDASVTVSASLRATILANGIRAPQKLFAIANGVELSSELPQRSPWEPGSFRVGAMGRLIPMKGFEFLVRAFGRIHQAVPSATLHLAGAGEDRARLDRIVSELGLTEKTRFWGYVDEPRDFIRKMDVMVFPSNAEEAFGLVAIETMAAGIPMIASRVPAVCEICRDGRDALLFEAGNVGQLASALLELRGNPDMRTQFVESAMERVRCCYSAQRMAESYEELYSALLGAPSTRAWKGPGAG